MNHLTNLYKNKCEQLKEQVQYLKRQLNEANTRGLGVIYSGDIQNQILALNPVAGQRPGYLDHVPPKNPDVNGFPRQPIDGAFFIDRYYYTWIFSEGLWKCLSSDFMRWNTENPGMEGYRPKVKIGTIYDPNHPGYVRSPGPPSPYPGVPVFGTWNRGGGILGVRG